MLTWYSDISYLLRTMMESILSLSFLMYFRCYLGHREPYNNRTNVITVFFSNLIHHYLRSTMLLSFFMRIHSYFRKIHVKCIVYVYSFLFLNINFLIIFSRYYFLNAIESDFFFRCCSQHNGKL